MTMAPLITLSSDFGYRDWYVGVMKGVILNLAPDIRIVDVSHDIAAHDIMEAALLLKETIPHFPEGSIHVCIVDPQVGTGRMPIAIDCGSYFLIGPDNGMFSLALENDLRHYRVYHLDKPRYWRTENPDKTFHGRDIFCPIAAHLANDIPIDQLGTRIEKIAELRWVKAINDGAGIQGWVVHIDRFGNCITNISRAQFESHPRIPVVKEEKIQLKAYVGSAIVDGIEETYASVQKGEILMLFGSSGFLEVSVNGEDAASLFSIKRGDPINILFS